MYERQGPSAVPRHLAQATILSALTFAGSSEPAMAREAVLAMMLWARISHIDKAVFSFYSIPPLFFLFSCTFCSC